jgi:G3E family GTPase
MTKTSVKLYKKLLVLVISGFLGSGKTTLLKHILENNKGLKIALIVNDIGEINIDANLIKNSKITETKENMVEMTNGCICCTLREDLLIAIKKLADQNAYDYLVIESSGISEPLPVAQTFTFEDENGMCLGNYANLDAMLTVVDGSSFESIYSEGTTLKDVGQELESEDYRTLANLLTDQVEFADIIVLNKLDLIDDSKKKVLRAILQKLNPNAKIIETIQSKVDLSEILNTNLFDLPKAQNSAGWIYELANAHISESEEYGISSFVYRARKPFDLRKFKKALTQMNGVIRGKGLYWISSDNRNIFEYSQAGVNISVGSPMGIWWAVADKEFWPSDQASIDRVEAMFEGEIGDRRQELVFIGRNMNQDQITQKLNNCLVEPKL